MRVSQKGVDISRAYESPVFRAEQARRNRARLAREDEARRAATAARFAAKGLPLAAALVRAGVA